MNRPLSIYRLPARGSGHRRSRSAKAVTLAALCSIASCVAAPPTPPDAGKPPIEGMAIGEMRSEQITIASPQGVARPPFSFTPEEDAFLDEVQRATFDYFWNDVAPETGMIPDRSSTQTVSVAGVGFQLSALCIGVERGWVTRDAAEQRARTIIDVLSGNPDNRRDGLFYHFISGRTGGQPEQAYEIAVSSIDTALLMAGLITASSYFGGDVAQAADRLVSEANWASLVCGDAADPARPEDADFISLAWKPSDPKNIHGPGRKTPWVWIDSGDEHRVVTFLAVAAPKREFGVEPELYYRLRRPLGQHPAAPRAIGDGTYAMSPTHVDEHGNLRGGEPGMMVFLPWSGAMFIHQFAHCWIDYAGMAADNPRARGVENRARVDWWENARRFTRMQQLKAIENPKKLAGFGEMGWGLTAGDWAKGYQVPGLHPQPIAAPGDRLGIDVPLYVPKDDWGDGTIAPYGAGSSIMFAPARALASMRWMRELKAADGKRPLAWRARGEPNGYGFASFNIASDWTAPEYIAIDQGPLILAIENARTGLLWKLFHQHPIVQEGARRLGWTVPAR
ncbi:MAG: glucoamylase family protein [Planctomycetota bacterium]|nr:glucoamylase family protein [Planctomycetota bacterium]